MKLDSVLNADMATLRGWLLTGLRWWISELRAMLPSNMLRGTEVRGPIALFDGDCSISFAQSGRSIPKVSGDHPRIVLSIPARFALTRTLDVPRIGLADIRRLVEIEAGRLTPLPPSETLIDVAPTPDQGNGDALAVAVAVLPKSVAREAIEAAERAQITPTAITLAPAAGAIDSRFDFAPLLRAQGLLPARKPTATLWWGLVAFAFLFNLILLVVRDQQAVEQVAAMVEQQAPAVAAARMITLRVRQFEINSALLVQRRKEHDALGALGAVSASLPAGAWVQRYSWNGRSVRLTGYKLAKEDVANALRHNPAFSGVRPTNNDVLAEIPAGQPFDVTAILRRTKP